jgi:uncharacterized surface protein with fasciclin (FAS1) repeats
MALDDNPDEVFDNEPEMEGNGDESPNRSFRYLMIGIIAVGALGVLLIGVVFLSKQNSNAQFAAQQLMVQQTNEAVIALSQITPPPPPTDTIVPTNTAVPPTPVPPTPTPGKKDLVETAMAAGNFKTLASLLGTAGLAEMLKGQGPYTIFAPTDDAFAQLSSESLNALKNDPSKLEALLKYHVVEGALPLSDMAKFTETKTLGGVPISITVNNDSTTVNGVKVNKSNGESSNGVIYPIDSVLVPPGMKGVVIVQAPPATTTASGAATAQPGKATPAAGGKTIIAQVQNTAQANAATKPASGATTMVSTRVPPGPGTVAPSGGITSTKPISGTTGQGLPTTGAGEDLFLLFLLALCLMMVIFGARRLRTMPR